MMSAPRLLRNSKSILLSNTLFKDLQLEKILSASTIAVLSRPCTQKEIIERNELFVLLENDENLNRIEHTLSTLISNEKALQVLQDTKIPLERYYRYADAFDAYLDACNALVNMHEFGSLFADVSNCYSAVEFSSHTANMKESVLKIRELLKHLQDGLVSFADKIWLTPNKNAASEFDNIATCATNLGFSIPSKKKLQHTKPNFPLSDAICRLHADVVRQIEIEIEKYADIDLYQPTVYISEIKFFLEIRRLINRADKIGVPHCISQIANTPQYITTALCDISLLAKNCHTIVPNDAEFTTNEPFCFLIGANGGGKTTYLRAVGINLILFLAGCPIFAKQAEIYPFEIVLCHFPKDERFDNTGRLDEEKKRTDEMLKDAEDKRAFLFFNETFSGTDDKKGFELLKSTVDQIAENKFFGVYVTHFHEVMSLDYPVLSAEVDFTNANKRTFRIVKSKGNASSYAADILKKYGLDKNSLAARRCTNGT